MASAPSLGSGADVSIVALSQTAGKPAISHLPKGAEVLVTDRVPGTSTDKPNRQIEVACNGSTFSVFLLDLQERAELITVKP